MLFLQVARQLGGNGRLAHTLEADQHQRSHALRLRERGVDRTHQVDQLLLADLDEVLTGCDADQPSGGVAYPRRDFFAERTLLDPGKEVPGDGEIDVGFEQRATDVTQRSVDILCGEFANAAEFFASRSEALGQGFEHGVSKKARRIADDGRLESAACRASRSRAPWAVSGAAADPPSRRRGEPQRGRLAGSRSPDPSEESMATEVEAQIAGSLWKIEKRVGDAVEANDIIMIIESMKMEIPVEAPCAGTIGEIRVQEGEAIEEGAVLALIE